MDNEFLLAIPNGCANHHNVVVIYNFRTTGLAISWQHSLNPPLVQTLGTDDYGQPVRIPTAIYTTKSPQPVSFLPACSKAVVWQKDRIATLVAVEYPVPFGQTGEKKVIDGQTVMLFGPFTIANGEKQYERMSPRQIFTETNDLLSQNGRNIMFEDVSSTCGYL